MTLGHVSLGLIVPDVFVVAVETLEGFDTRVTGNVSHHGRLNTGGISTFLQVDFFVAQHTSRGTLTSGQDFRSATQILKLAQSDHPKNNHSGEFQ